MFLEIISFSSIIGAVTFIIYKYMFDLFTKIDMNFVNLKVDKKNLELYIENLKRENKKKNDELESIINMQNIQKKSSYETVEDEKLCVEFNKLFIGYKLFEKNLDKSRKKLKSY